MDLETSLTKEELTRFCSKDNSSDGIFLIYTSFPREYYSLKIPLMLLKSIAQFRNKSIFSLIVEDAKILFDSVNSEYIWVNSSQLKKWRKGNNLKCFGISQYMFLRDYLHNFQNYAGVPERSNGRD